MVMMLSAVCLTAFGQKKFGKITPADFATPAEAADTTVDAVFIYEIGETEFAARTNYFTLETHVKARIHILTEKGKEYANKTIPYHSSSKKASSDNDKVQSIQAAAYNLVGGKVEKTSMPGKYVFHEKVNDNYMCAKFTVPDVKVGSIIEYSYDISSPRCSEIPTWYLQKTEPVRYNYYSVTIPDWYDYHIEDRGYKIIKGTSKQTKITFPGGATLGAKNYVVEAENLRPFKPEGFIYCQNDYIQRVDFELISINSIELGIFETYTTTWHNVRTFLDEKGSYGSHLKIKNPYAEEMAALGLEGKPVSEKASKIFALLKSKLKWDKTYALASDNPLKAVKAGKGSNIDLNFIFMAMLRDAGIKSTPLLIRGRTNGRLPFTHASIDMLNTFIVAIADESGSLLFADCSADYGDINVLPDKLLAEGVLYDPSLPTNPASAPTRGEIYDLAGIGGNSSIARIDCIITPEGTIAGQRIYNHVGFNALMYKNAYHEYEDSIAMINSKEKGLECKLSAFRVKNADGPGRITEERIRFTKDLVSDGGKIYFNPLVFADEKTNHFTKSERVLPIEFPALQSTKITTNITIPEGYAIESMPQNQHIDLEDYLSADISFALNGNVLTTKYVSNVDNTYIPADKYAKLQEFWNSLLKLNSTMISLKKQ